MIFCFIFLQFFPDLPPVKEYQQHLEGFVPVNQSMTLTTLNSITVLKLTTYIAYMHNINQNTKEKCATHYNSVTTK